MSRLQERFAHWIIRRFAMRAPDVVIGGNDRPYLLRWCLIPRNPVLNLYLHNFKRSDDDRAEHDHPWLNASYLLLSSYIEWRKGVPTVRRQGSLTVRVLGSIRHRIELHEGSVWTLFITGPRYREWGFHCPRGWVHWKAFTAADDPGSIGKGCDQ